MTKYIKEVSDLISLVKEFSVKPSQMIYRGQFEDWPILPSLFRENKEDNLKIERALLEKLRLNSPVLPSGLNDWFDFLVFAQQHSMPTRMIDWTYSPLIALWFACFLKSNVEKEADGVLFVSDSTRYRDVRRKDFDSVKASSFKRYLDGLGEHTLLKPGPLFNRINNQNGIFMVSPSIQSELKVPFFEKYIIPTSAKKEILQELVKLNITEYTIFGDHDSFCRTIYNEVYTHLKIYGDEPPEPLFTATW